MHHIRSIIYLIIVFFNSAHFLYEQQFKGIGFGFRMIKNNLLIFVFIAFIHLFSSSDCFASTESIINVDALKNELKIAKKESVKLRNFCVNALGVASCLTGNGGHNFQELQCYALGVGLGISQKVRHLRPESSENTLISNNADDAAIAASKFEKLEIAIKEIIGNSKSEYSQQWNLDCAGKFGIPNEFFSVYGNFFRYNKKYKMLTILGDVDADFSKKLNFALTNSPGVQTIVLSSGGGSVNQAIIAGKTIRRMGLNTQLGGSCYSACPLVFIGGVNRTSFSPHPILGFHQISYNGIAIPMNHKAYEYVYYYANEMRVDPNVLITLMQSALPNGMKNITANEEIMCKSNIVTWAQRACASKDYGW